MASEAFSSATTNKFNHKKQLPQQQRQEEKRHRSIFEVPPEYFNSCHLLQFPSSSLVPIETLSLKSAKDVAENYASKNEEEENSRSNDGVVNSNAIAMHRWSCNTCKAEFESLQEQRSHFKSDIHRLNIKLTIAGKGTIKEEDFDETTSDSLCKDHDVSSISGSEDEDDKESLLYIDAHIRSSRKVSNKLFIQLKTGERVSVWKCLLLDESENIAFENDKSVIADDGSAYLTDEEVTEKLKYVIHEPRDGTRLRVVLLARGGHFAGCVFDGTSVITYKTFHRYVIRAKAGKKQSSKDASGKAAHSAGASLRRYNELALKKDIQELLASWKPYFAASSCIFLHAPSNNRQLFFDGGKPYFFCHPRTIRNIPLTVQRPTFKESRRIYNLLAQISSEIDEEIYSSTVKSIKEGPPLSAGLVEHGHTESSKSDKGLNLETKESFDTSTGVAKFENVLIPTDPESENENICVSTPLHEAVKSGNPQEVLELLEQGLDPCIKDEKGQTPYMLATEKEVRNMFRRFMALNLNRWDWHAAKVPSALTKEMEESQATKQAEKDAKRKARAKELKKFRKAREKKAQAEAAESNDSLTVSKNYGSTPISVLKGPTQSSSSPRMSKEEELKRAQDAEREKRAAAAERRIEAVAALKAQGTASVAASSQSKVTDASEISCSCCHVSLAGKVPFHRYNYKYCSTSCMHVHREILEDG